MVTPLANLLQSGLQYHYRSPISGWGAVLVTCLDSFEINGEWQRAITKTLQSLPSATMLVAPAWFL